MHEKRATARTVVEDITWLVCDGCQKSVIDDDRPNDDTTWFRLGYRPPMSSFLDPPITDPCGDYCSLHCLGVAVNRAVTLEVRA